MADGNSLLGTLLGGEESEGPWSIEETQLQILDKITGLVKNAHLDTKSLTAISKNVAVLAKDTDTAEDMKKQLEEIAKVSKDDAKNFKDYRKAEQTRSKTRSTEYKGLVDSLSDRSSVDILKGGGEGGGLGKAAVKGTKGLLGFGSSLLEADGSLLSIAKSAGIFGGALGTIIAYVAGTIDTFRDMSDIGQTFGGNMFQMTIDAGNAGLSLKSMTTIIKKHSAFAAGPGLKSMLDHQSQVRELTRDYGHFGLSMEDLTELSANHLEQLQVRGQFDRMSNMQRGQATKKYLLELTQLSQATGKSRKELAEAHKKEAESAGRNAAAMTARAKGMEGQFLKSEEAMKKITANMNPEQTKKFMDNFYNSVTRGTAMVDGNMKAYMLLGPEVSKAARQLDKSYNAMDPAGIEENGIRLKRALADMIKSGGSSAIAMMERTGVMKEDIRAALELAALEAKTIDAQERMAGESLKHFADRIKQQNEENDATSKALKLESDFQKKIGEIRSKLMSSLLPIIEFFADSLPDTFGGLITTIGLVTAAFIAFKIAMKANLVKKGGSALLGKLSGGKFGGGGGGGLLQNASMGGGGPASKIGGMGMGDKARSGMLKFAKGLKSLGKGIGGLISGIMKGFATGLMAFANPAVAVGALGFSAAVLLIGGAVAGVAALAGLALPILADGLKAMAEAFHEFANLDGMALITAGAGIGAISIALIAFAGSKVADAVGSFVSGIAGLFGADSPIDQLEEIAKLGPGLLEAAMGLTGLSRAFATFGQLPEQKDGGLLSMFADTDAEDMAQMLGEQASKVGSRRGATTAKSKFLSGADEAEQQTSVREQMTIAFDSSSIAKNSTLMELLDAIKRQNEVLKVIASSNEVSAKFSKELSDKVGRSGRLN